MNPAELQIANTFPDVFTDSGVTTTTADTVTTEIIADGRRNDTMARMAGALRRKGASVPAILAALDAVNQAQCQPPLPDREIRAIAESIGRYRPVNESEPGDSTAVEAWNPALLTDAVD